MSDICVELKGADDGIANANRDVALNHVYIQFLLTGKIAKGLFVLLMRIATPL
jgi:hypothetical protein